MSRTGLIITLMIILLFCGVICIAKIDDQHQNIGTWGNNCFKDKTCKNNLVCVYDANKYEEKSICFDADHFKIK